MSPTLYTPEEVAAMFVTSRRDVLARCRTGEYPHIRIGRKVRFTDEHLSLITGAHEVAAAVEPENPWGVRRRTRRAS